MAKILVIDDSEDMRDFFSTVLNMYGYEVKTAFSLNGELTSFKPDLILLEVMSKDTDGRKICKEIKTKNQDKNIPILLLSTTAALLKDYEQCGADDILEKPFSIYTLIEKINTLLK